MDMFLHNQVDNFRSYRDNFAKVIFLHPLPPQAIFHSYWIVSDRGWHFAKWSMRETAWEHGLHVLNCKWGDTWLRARFSQRNQNGRVNTCILSSIYVYLFVSSPGVRRDARKGGGCYSPPLPPEKSRDSHTQALWFFSKILLYLFTAVVDSRANPYSMKDAGSRREAAGSRTLVQIKASTCI